MYFIITPNNYQKYIASGGNGNTGRWHSPPPTTKVYSQIASCNPSLPVRVRADGIRFVEAVP